MQQATQVPYSPIETFIRNSVQSDRQEYVDLVKEWAVFYGNNTDLALCLVFHESGFNPKAKNKGSSASSLFQFIRSTFNSTAIRMNLPYSHTDNVFNAEINAEMGNWLLKEDGYTHWIVWRNCV